MKFPASSETFPSVAWEQYIVARVGWQLLSVMMNYIHDLVGIYSCIRSYAGITINSIGKTYHCTSRL